MFKLVVFFAVVAMASAGVVAPYGHGVGYAPAVSYHAPLATSYANTYKVAYAGPSVTKVLAAPTVTKIAYAAPSIAYPTPVGYSSLGYNNYGYGLGYTGHGYGLGYGHGYGGYSGLGYGSYSGYGHGYY